MVIRTSLNLCFLSCLVSALWITLVFCINVSFSRLVYFQVSRERVTSLIKLSFVLWLSSYTLTRFMYFVNVASHTLPAFVSSINRDSCHALTGTNLRLSCVKAVNDRSIKAISKYACFAFLFI